MKDYANSTFRKIIYAIVAGIWLFIFIDTVSADETKTFTWVVPSENVDDSPLDPDELVRYELGCSNSPTATPGVYAAWQIDDVNVTSRVDTFPPGNWYCRLKVFADNGDDPDIGSDWSNEVFFSIALPRPKAPSLSVN